MEAPEHVSSSKKRKEPEANTGSSLATLPDPKVLSKGQTELIKALKIVTQHPEYSILKEHRYFQNFKRTFLLLKKGLSEEDDATTAIAKLNEAFQEELKYSKLDNKAKKEEQDKSDAIAKDSEYRKDQDEWYQANLTQISGYGLNIIGSAYKHGYSGRQIEGFINSHMATAECTGKGKGDLPTFRIVLGTIKGATHTIVFSVDENSGKIHCFHAGEGG